MALTIEKAYDVLELPNGADQDSVRTSYKRLALKWHPDKHSNSNEATKKFQQISRAYKKLTVHDDSSEDSSDDEGFEMSLDDMLRLFRDIFFARTLGSLNGFDSNDDDDMDDDDDEDDYMDDHTYYSYKSKMDYRRRQDLTDTVTRTLTPEEINRNAEELITEEEKEKRKAEKRRAKKKRRRERKKLEKQTDHEQQDDKKSGKSKVKDGVEKEELKGKNKKQDKKNTVDSSSSSDEASFDPHSAFFTKVVNKKKKGQPEQSSKKVKSKDKSAHPHNAKSEEEAEELDPVVLRSRQLAIRGNEMAQLGHYTAAIDLFTEAIKLDPFDFRFFGNRSYCFDRIQQYDKALRDAEKAISISSEWPKGYFRRGRALAGLKIFSDAEQSFMQVLKLDKNCDDAVQELLRVRTHQLTDMGFSRQQAEAAIKQFGTVQTALDSLLAGVVAESSVSNDIYVSDEEEFSLNNPIPFMQHMPSDTKMDPNNPDGLTALWVGNVLPEVTEKKLIQMFSKFGSVTSVRCLPEKYCAFVNFKSKEAAGHAMQSLQGHECCGQRLLIKFPDNPIVNGNVKIGKNSTVTPSLGASVTPIGASVSPIGADVSPIGASAAPLPIVVPCIPSASLTDTISSVELNDKSKNLPKQSGPVNGDECYFWRTTGCQFGDKCHYRHQPDHKGLDRKPWQKVK